MASSQIPHLDSEVSTDYLKEGVAKIVEILHPEWSTDAIRIEHRSTGYMRRNYALTESSCSNGLFLRIVDTNIPGQLDRAVNCMRYLTSQNLDAKLLLTFRNGLVMELIHGEIIPWENVDRVRKMKIFHYVAREMAKYHHALLTGRNWNAAKSQRWSQFMNCA